MTSLPISTHNEIVFFLRAVVFALGVACVFLLIRADRRREAAHLSIVGTLTPPPDASREIKVISEMMRSYIRETRNYSSYLNETNEQLAKPIEQLELMSVVASLIKENKSLLDSSYELQLRLEESQNRINIL